MSKIASMLKQEITRLARKEVSAGTRVLKKANAQYRRDIAELKRQAKALSGQVAYLERLEKKRAPGRVSDANAGKRRFSPRGLKTHRRKLGLSAADYARLIGVTGQTVYNWEQGKSRPAEQQLTSLVAVRALGKREALKRLELLDG